MFQKDSLGRREVSQSHLPLQLASQYFATASKLPGWPTRLQVPFIKCLGVFFPPEISYCLLFTSKDNEYKHNTRNTERQLYTSHFLFRSAILDSLVFTVEFFFSTSNTEISTYVQKYQ